MLHVCDWLPTLYEAAGGNQTKLKNLDGVSAWKMLSTDGPPVRSEMLHNIDPIGKFAGIRVGDYKLGYNDVSFHGSNQIPTPNIDKLAYSGVLLNNYYVSPICTPTRSALMTGRHPIHTETLMPQHLKPFGYRSHIVGKWHLGMFANEYTPLYRGFESHFGYYQGCEDYYDHTYEAIPDQWAMVSALDDGVGAVYSALQNNKMADNAIIVFTTDNGGPANGYDYNAANNYPLRGVKATLWEGGVRGVGLIHSPLLSKSGYVSQNMLHVCDWLPTLYEAAGGNPTKLKNLDGVSAWKMLSTDGPPVRSEMLHNIDPIGQFAGWVMEFSECLWERVMSKP
nr:hypothetical protein BaRGS_026602 [Batillaria attramentaria]